MATMDYKQVMYVDTASSLPSAADDGQLAFIKDSQSTSTYSTATSSWTPLGRSVVFKSNTNVNGMSTGSTAIYTLPPSPLYFYPTGIIMRAVTITGAGTKPVITLGSNSTAYDNIATGSLVTSALGLLDVNNGTPMLATFSPGLAGSAVVYAKVTTGAILYSAFTVKFDILGFYDSTSP